MPSERVQRRIDRLLDQADQSLEDNNWQSAIEASEAALGFDPDNADAKSFLDAARRAQGAVDAGGAAVGSEIPPRTPGAQEPAGPASGSSRFTSDFEMVTAMRDESIRIAKTSGQKPTGTDGLSGQSPGQSDMQARGPEGGGLNTISFILDALAEDRFRLFRQPIVSVSDFTIKQYEVLVRMVTREGPLLSPGEFFPEAESLNLIQRIDQWVIEHSMQKWKSRDEAGVALPMAINISGMSVGKDIAIYLREQADFFGVPHEAITVEIAETAALQDVSLAGEMAGMLHGDGFRVAIDDFKGGANSLSKLRDLDFEYLKLDGSLVMRLTESMVDREFVSGLANLAHDIGAELIGEFVQNGATIDCLAQCKIEYAQGYYLGVPEPFPD